MYNQLFTAWRREVTDPSLGDLPADFYSKLTAYMKQLCALQHSVDNKSVKYRLLMTEENNVKLMIGELFNARYKKIIDIITRNRKIPTEALTPEEVKISKSFFNFKDGYCKLSEVEKQGSSLSDKMPTDYGADFGKVVEEEAAKRDSSQVVDNVKVPSVTEQVPKVIIVKPAMKRVTVRFSKAIPAIMGSDMKSYGPFAAEDVASLPELNAKILVKQGLATLIEVS